MTWLWKEAVFLWNDGMRGEWLAFVLLFLFTALLMSLLALISWGCLWMADHAYRPTETAKGEVVGKVYVPQSTQMILVGKVMVPQTVPESFRVNCEIYGEGEAWMSVSEEFYRQAKPGDRVMASYDKGRITGQINLRGLRLQ